MKTPVSLPPPPRDLESIRADVVARLERPLKEIWPAGAGELLGYEMGFTPEELLVRIRYQSAKPLDEPAWEILSNVLKTQLKVDKLRLELQWEKPAPAPGKPRSTRTSQAVKK